MSIHHFFAVGPEPKARPQAPEYKLDERFDVYAFLPHPLAQRGPIVKATAEEKGEPFEPVQT